MKRNLLVAAAAMLVALGALAALPGSPRARIRASTTAFSIDGKRFLSETSVGDDHSAIRRELRKQGLDIRLDGPPPNVDPRLVGILRENGDATVILPLPLPRGLSAAHVMRMESPSGPLDLALGTSDLPPRTALERLRASGWDCIQAAHEEGQVFIASRKNGRETLIVLLEEKERGFLFLRRVEE